MHSGFRAQLTALIGMVAATVVVAILLVSHALISDKVTRDQGDALQALARSISTMLGEGLHERLREIELLAGSPDFERHLSDAPRITRTLNRVQATYSHYSWLGLATLDGQVRMSAQDLLVGKDVSSRPWFVDGQHRPYVGDVHEAKLLAKALPPDAQGEPLRFVDFAAPVHGANGQVVGVLGAHENWAWVRGVVQALRSHRARDQGVLVFILDRNGNVIHRPDGPDGQVEPPAVARLPSSQGMVDWSDGQACLTATAAVTNADTRVQLGWTVVVRQPKDMALQAAATARRTILWVGAVGTALAMCLAWWVAGFFSRPLQSISLVARRIEAGDWSAHVPEVKASTELRQLSGSLRSMTAALQRHQQALEEANATLEDRVKDRTDELQRANAELEILARKDGLTGLFNRRAAQDRMQEESTRHRRNGQRLSLLMLDIDHFKKINDRFGHAAGDLALKSVAACLNHHCRGSDFIARIGGEEFLVLLPETAMEGGLRLAEKLRDAVAHLDVPEVGRLSTSVGVAVFGADPCTVEDVLKQADQALYAAKQGGRNRVVGHGRLTADAATGG